MGSSLFSKVYDTYSDGGISGLAIALMETILVDVIGLNSKRIGVYNGVAVRDVSLLSEADERPNYEEPLIDAINKNVEDGMDVAVIGGGLGASTVSAARRVGVEGSVRTFEAARSQVSVVEETIRLNCVGDIARVEHAVIETPGRLYGEMNGATKISASDLPDCDAIVMDCDGAESEILENIAVCPEVIIVETHDVFDSPEKMVRSKLDTLGYEVIDRGVEVEEKGVFILTAVRKE